MTRKQGALSKAERIALAAKRNERRKREGTERAVVEARVETHTIYHDKHWVKVQQPYRPAVFYAKVEVAKVIGGRPTERILHKPFNKASLAFAWGNTFKMRLEEARWKLQTQAHADVAELDRLEAEDVQSHVD